MSSRVQPLRPSRSPAPRFGENTYSAMPPCIGWLVSAWPSTFLALWQAPQCPAPSTRYLPRFHSAERFGSGWNCFASRYSLSHTASMLRMLKGQPSSGGSVDLAHRLHGVEVRLDRIHVAARHVREPRIRERRIQPLALLIDAFVHRAVEIVLAPRADAGIRIGRDVGRIDDPERRRYRTPARIGFAARRGVARLAIAGAREVAAGFDGSPGVVGTHGRI